jgi:hypothetical protein
LSTVIVLAPMSPQVSARPQARIGQQADQGRVPPSGEVVPDGLHLLRADPYALTGGPLGRLNRVGLHQAVNHRLAADGLHQSQGFQDSRPCARVT